MKLDLADLKSVRECAASMEQAVEKIDILINNAGSQLTNLVLGSANANTLWNSLGVMLCPDWKTADGFDMQLGTNHLGHFLLNELLLPLVRKSAASGFHPRIVITSSMAHEAGMMHWDDLQFEKDFDSTKAYCQSKLANILHAKELARRLDGSGIWKKAAHINCQLYLMHFPFRRHFRVLSASRCSCYGPRSPPPEVLHGQVLSVANDKPVHQTAYPRCTDDFVLRVGGFDREWLRVVLQRLSREDPQTTGLGCSRPEEVVGNQWRVGWSKTEQVSRRKHCFNKLLSRRISSECS